MSERESNERLTNHTPEALVKLRERSLKIDSQLCVGVDVYPNGASTPDELFVRNEYVIEASQHRAAAFKFQLSGYLALGSKGIELLEKSVAAAQHSAPDVPIIIDGKFNDIGVSLDYYAQFAFDHLGADAATANPFLGEDANDPVLRRSEKLIYFVSRTSNPGAQEFQDIDVNGLSLSEHAALRINDVWNNNGNAGLVVGATADPEIIAKMRAAAPWAPFLMPGLGTQGANPEDFVYHAQNSDAAGILVNVSRGITQAEDPETAAAYWSREIRKGPRKRVVNMLTEAGCIEHGEFTLASGEKSSVYVDVRRLSSRPDILKKIAEAMNRNLVNSDHDVIATIPTGGLPLAAAMAIDSQKPMVYVRKERKGYGTESLIEGGIDVSGKRVVLVDDVISNGGSKVDAIAELRRNGAYVADIGVVMDRRGNEGEDFQGVPVHYLAGISDIM
jgi:uridine monophosphate synthetase